jgi:hypothetical protein
VVTHINTVAQITITTRTNPRDVIDNQVRVSDLFKVPALMARLSACFTA